MLPNLQADLPRLEATTRRPLDVFWISPKKRKDGATPSTCCDVRYNMTVDEWNGGPSWSTRQVLLEWFRYAIYLQFERLLRPVCLRYWGQIHSYDTQFVSIRDGGFVSRAVPAPIVRPVSVQDDEPVDTSVGIEETNEDDHTVSLEDEIPARIDSDSRESMLPLEVDAAPG